MAPFRQKVISNEERVDFAAAPNHPLLRNYIVCKGRLRFVVPIGILSFIYHIACCVCVFFFNISLYRLAKDLLWSVFLLS